MQSSRHSRVKEGGRKGQTHAEGNAASVIESTSWEDDM